MNKETPLKAEHKMKGRIRFFSSFEEMNEAGAKEMALLTPVEHLQNATALIKKVYAEELKNNKPDKKIHFKIKDGVEVLPKD